MLTLTNSHIRLTMKEDGTGVVVEDVIRKEGWVLDETTRYVSSEVKRFDNNSFQSERIDKRGSKVALLGRGRAEKVNDQTLVCRHSTRQGNVLLRWELRGERLHVTALPEVDHCASSLALPGTFRPRSRADFHSLIANVQGFVHKGKGPAFFKAFCSPTYLSMCMYGQMADRGGLLSIMETDPDAVMIWEKTEEGAINLQWVQQPTFGKLGYARETVLVPTAPEITPICKAYRKYEIEKKRFKSWDEKIEERPILRKLFGSTSVCVGYFRDDKLDYAENFRALRKMGVQNARVVPAYIGTTMKFSFDEKGVPSKGLDLRNLVPLFRKLDYQPHGFIYVAAQPVAKGKNPHRFLMQDEAGKPRLNWSMAGIEFYLLTAKERFRWAKKYLDEEFKGLTGVHFDTLACNFIQEDHNPSCTITATEDQQATCDILKYACDKKLLVTAEGFWGRMTPYYDMGSTKMQHMVCRDEYYNVPLTMLVYHDTCIHNWWEFHNYNNPVFRSHFGESWKDRFYFGSGYPALQSANDALMGTPPDVMPFGMSYFFVPKNEPDIAFFRFRKEESALEDALKYAKRVSDLNRRIGKLEMMDLKIHKGDGCAIQETVFSDGTRIIGNFSNTVLEAPKIGPLQAESWVELRD